MPATSKIFKFIISLFFLLNLISLIITAVFIFPGLALAQAPSPTPSPTGSPTSPAPSTPSGLTELQLQIPIGERQSLTVSASTIAEYIQSVVVFASAAIIALAIVMIIVGGVQWVLASGTPNKISNAKNTIVKAFLGMFIAIFSVFVLGQINPALIEFRPIVPIELEREGICCQYTVPDAPIESYTVLTAKECQDRLGKEVSFNECTMPHPYDINDILNKMCPGGCYDQKCNRLGLQEGGGPCPKGKYCCKVPRCTNNSDCKSNICDSNGCRCNTTADCKAGEYCKEMGVRGNCVPRLNSGKSCEINNTYKNGAGKGDRNDMCITKNCVKVKGDRGTRGSWVVIDYTCSPTGNGKVGDFEKRNGEFCTDKDQCANGHCYIEEKYATLGMCLTPVTKGWPCEDRNLVKGGDDDKNSPCASGMTCEKWTATTSRCK